MGKMGASTDTPTPIYVVGDKVQVIAKTYGEDYTDPDPAKYLGEFATIMVMDDSEIPLRLHFDNGDDTWARECEVQPIGGTPPTTPSPTKPTKTLSKSAILDMMRTAWTCGKIYGDDIKEESILNIWEAAMKDIAEQHKK